MRRLLTLIGCTCVLSGSITAQMITPCRAGAHPAPHIEFPEIHDFNSLRINLERTGCFGTCPQYSIEVSGDGFVTYDGSWYAKYCGQWRGTIPESSVRELISQFRAADYFRLNREYSINATDLPTYTTAIAFDNVAKCVADYGGNLVDMPASVRKLEDAIDRVAGPEHWTTREHIPPKRRGGLPRTILPEAGSLGHAVSLLVRRRADWATNPWT
jgi:hypothetical protein